MGTRTFSRANRVYKSLKAINYVGKGVSRRAVVKAISRVLDMDKDGDILPSKTSYPDVPILLHMDNRYNNAYIGQVYGLLRYIRGDYSPEFGDKER